MKSIEIIVANLEEGKVQAANQLGVDPDQVTIEVLDESKGLFGRPGKITIKATTEDAQEDTAEKKEAKEEKPKPKRSRTSTAKKEEPKKEEKVSEDSSDDDAEESDEREEVVATQEDADTILGYLTTLLEEADMDAEVTCSGLNGRYVNLQINGKDVGYLIGRRGEVLNAIQYLLNVISARRLQNGVRVVLEGDDYREKRAEVLAQMAQDIADQVLERGEEAVLDALPAFERRVIHQALSEIEGISTYSEGEEPDRRVVIAPAEAV